jgi:lysosomal-associated membrane protein 1/2
LMQITYFNMISKIPSVFLLIVGFILIASTNAVNLPGNYTIPPTGQDLCFAARFDLVLNVEYLKLDGKTNTSRIPLNNETYLNYDGSCLKNDTHFLTITMLDGLTTVTLEFSLNEKNQTSLKRVLATINVNRNPDYFLNVSASVLGPHVFLANESLFATDRSHSYRCNSRTSIDNFKSDRNITLKSIDIENLRVQPFIDQSGTFTDYAAAKVCFKSSNLIPIIVGVVLAVLVIVILVAYLIGRRRNRNGYQSV